MSEVPDSYFEPAICKTPLPSYSQLEIELSATQQKLEAAVAENAELTRKLAEQQAWMSFVWDELCNISVQSSIYAVERRCSKIFGKEKFGQEELTKLLAKAYSEAVPEGWKLVPIDISNHILFRENLRRYARLSFGETKNFWAGVLAAAPQPDRGSNE